MTYAQKLKDPRWQKKRLEILERDEWSCRKCGDSESTLHVHHRAYDQGKDPWDYDNRLLVTLCEDCHDCEKLEMDDYTKLLGYVVKSHCAFAADIFYTAEAIHRAFKNSPENDIITLDAIQWAISGPFLTTILQAHSDHRDKILKKKSSGGAGEH